MSSNQLNSQHTAFTGGWAPVNMVGFWTEHWAHNTEFELCVCNRCDIANVRLHQTAFLSMIFYFNSKSIKICLLNTVCMVFHRKMSINISSKKFSSISCLQESHSYYRVKVRISGRDLCMPEGQQTWAWIN